MRLSIPSRWNVAFVASSAGVLSILDAQWPNDAPSAPFPVRGTVVITVAVDAKGSRAYVGNEVQVGGEQLGAVSLIDTSTNKVIKTILLGRWPLSLALNSYGTRLYALSMDPEGTKLFKPGEAKRTFSHSCCAPPAGLVLGRRSRPKVAIPTEPTRSASRR